MEPTPRPSLISNALEQTAIVQHLLQFIPKDISSLQNFRIVCKTWRDGSQVVWNHLHGTLTIYQTHYTNNHPHFDQGMIEIGSLQLDQFRQQYSNQKDSLFKYPFQKYDLRFWNLHPYHFSEGPINLDNWFWRTCSPIIKHLTLHYCNSFGAFTIFSEQFLRALPNITFLKVLGGTLTPEGLQGIHQQYLHKVDYFGHLKLKSLNLELTLPEEQLKEVWGVFQKSLPYLEDLKIRKVFTGKKPEDNGKFDLNYFTCKLIGHRSGQVLERLEVDWRWGRGGWRGFGRVVKGLRELKGVVRGDEQLREVGEIWGEGLKRLEMGHGSGGFSREGIMEVVVEGMGSLKEFRWRGCPCLRKEVGKGDWKGAEEGLRRKLGEGRFTVPWGMEERGNLEGICLEKEFDKAVKTGRIEEGLLEKMMEY